MLLELEQQTRLGPARVLRMEGNRVQVELPDPSLHGPSSRWRIPMSQRAATMCSPSARTGRGM